MLLLNQRKQVLMLVILEQDIGIDVGIKKPTQYQKPIPFFSISLEQIKVTLANLWSKETRNWFARETFIHIEDCPPALSRTRREHCGTL